MKKITFFMLLISPFIWAQTTNIPDTSFEDALILAGIDVTDAFGFPDGFIDNADAANVQSLIINNSYITDLTGIEAFVNLTYLDISFNGYGAIYPLTNVNLSNSANLQTLICNDNFMTDLDITNLQNLETLNVRNNELSNLDFAASTNLKFLNAENNNIQALNLSQHILLQQVTLQNNQLTTLNLRNTSNSILTTFIASGNSSLSCISVDSETDALAANGSYSSWIKDSSTTYSNNCATLNVNEFENKQERLFAYPNPVKNMVGISSKNDIKIVEVLSLNGKVLKTATGTNSLSMENFDAGIYFLNIQTEKSIQTIKIIKQ